MNPQNTQTNLNEPSVKQLRCIMALCRENKLDEAAYQPETKKQASEMIDELKALPGSKPRSDETPIGPRLGRSERIQAFELVTRILAEQARSASMPVPLDAAFWASVRETHREYERQILSLVRNGLA